jgi:hypothetical protein
MSHPLLKHKAFVASATVCAVLVAVGAYAYWTNGGSGSGSAASGTNAAITVTQTTTPTGLYPGGAASSLAGKFNNTNDGSVHVNEVSATIGAITGPNITVGTPCTADDYVLDGFPVTVDDDIAVGTAVGAWTGGTIAMLETGVNQDGCKGATVTVNYTSN